MTSDQELIDRRRAPTTLDTSEDFRKRMSGDVKVTNSPLDHTTNIFKQGMQGVFRTPVPELKWR